MITDSGVARVICVGHSALDRVFTVDAWPQASAKVRATSLVEVGGGKAAAAAAIKCTRPGGRGGSPSRGEVAAFLREA